MNVVAMLAVGILIVYELEWNLESNMPPTLNWLISMLLFSVFATAMPTYIYSEDDERWYQVYLFNLMNFAQAICSTGLFYYILEDAKDNVNSIQVLKFSLVLAATLFNVSRFLESGAMQ